MSGSGKLVLFVLIAFALIFALGIGIGVMQKEERPRATKDFAGNYDPPWWAKAFDTLVAPFRPRLELRQDTFRVQPSTTTSPITIPPSEDEYRTAAFHLRSGAGAKIRYEADTTEESDLREQELELPLDQRDGSKNPRGSLTVLKVGGRLWITCKGGAGSVPCRIDLE